MRQPLAAADRTSESVAARGWCIATSLHAPYDVRFPSALQRDPDVGMIDMLVVTSCSWKLLANR